MTTFAPTSVRLGDVVLALDGEQSFVRTMDLRPDINVIAQVELKYEQNKGIAQWLFTSLDPMTMEETDDFMQGILTISSGSNVGNVTYDICLRESLPQGTEIHNRAAIKFDDQATIMTPDWINVIDGIAPESHITVCEMVNDSTAAINISARDDLSGPWRYDVMAQYGIDAEWEVAATHVPCDSMAQIRVYEGINQGFYVVLTDSAGNVENKTALREYSLDYFSPNADTELAINISKGWTWVSHNQNDVVGIEQLPNAVQRVVSFDGETIRDSHFGMTGNIHELQATQLYKVMSNQETKLQCGGKLFNSTFKPIPLEAGWNWIGYPMHGTLSINDALIRLQANEEDCIVGQDGSAVFHDGMWIGTLTQLEPGKGYMLHVGEAQTLKLNDTKVNISQPMSSKTARKVEEWQVDIHRYPNVMPIIADLYDGNFPVNDDETYALAAFCGNECRGVAQQVQNHWMMNVVGHSGEHITFLVLKQGNNGMVKAQESVTMEQQLIGSLQHPLALHIGESSAIEETGASILRVFPTMATQNVTVDAGGSNIDHLFLINNKGQTVMEYENIDSGMTLDVSSLSDGVYVVNVILNGNSVSTKIVKQTK